MRDIPFTPHLSGQVSEARISDYITLLKPRVMSLVVFTGFSGMVAAPGFGVMHPVLILAAILALALGAGAAGAINMALEGDIDTVMKRTRHRPIPMGRIPASEALTFGTVLSLLSVLTMGVAVNWIAAGLLAFANFFYVVIYTLWLKRRTPQNIVIGGAAGAFPPVIGWAAVTGDISLFPAIMFLIIFLWTPPHFWALSLFARNDYARAKLPMLPCVAGEDTTRRQMLIYTLILFPVSVAPWMLGLAGATYGLCATALSGFFVYTAVCVLRDKTDRSARLMFGYSVFYLFALFTGVMINAAQ